MVTCCLLFFPSGGLGRTHFSPACCRTLVVIGHWFSRPAPPDLGGDLVARRGVHCAPAIHHSMTREDQSRRPVGGDCQSAPKGPGAASIGGLSGVLLRCAGHTWYALLPAAPVKIRGSGGRWCGDRGRLADRDRLPPPPGGFFAHFWPVKNGPPSLVFRPSSPVK